MNQATASPSAVTRGTLLEKTRDRIVLALPGTDYQLHLQISQPVTAEIGKPIAGTIRAAARRVDVVRTGGRFIEPVYGRPRRLQGVLLSTDPAQETITVQCGSPTQPCPVVCRLMPQQAAADLPRGTLVSFDVEPGAIFEQMP